MCISTQLKTFTPFAETGIYAELTEITKIAVIKLLPESDLYKSQKSPIINLSGEVIRQ